MSSELLLTIGKSIAATQCAMVTNLHSPGIKTNFLKVLGSGLGQEWQQNTLIA